MSGGPRAVALASFAIHSSGLAGMGSWSVDSGGGTFQRAGRAPPTFGLELESRHSQPGEQGRLSITSSGKHAVQPLSLPT